MSAPQEPALLPFDDLPQGPRLAQFVAELWADPTVAAVWLGGSLARGQADAYSDVDLRVALQPEAYNEDRLPEAAKGLESAATTCVKFQFSLDTVLWHLLLDDGTIYDLHVQSVETDPPVETRLVLACREPAFGEKLAQIAEAHDHDFPPAQPDDMARVLQFFWMNQQKHLKALHRGLPLLAWQGEFLMRQDLIRLQYVLGTGKDCGPVSRMTIHALTPVIQTVQQLTGDRMLRVVGQPMRIPGELMDATALLRDEVARVGRLLAENLGFDYPAAAEETVRRNWEHFNERLDHAV